jgi:hypothetical protein
VQVQTGQDADNGTLGTLGTVVGLGRYTTDDEIVKESADKSSDDILKIDNNEGKIIDTSTNGCNVSQMSQASQPQEISTKTKDIFQTEAAEASQPQEISTKTKDIFQTEAAEASQPPQQSSVITDKPYIKKKYECYYCDKLGTDDEDVYEKHGVLTHPSKPGYPSRADIEKYGLKPQDKPWEL